MDDLFFIEKYLQFNIKSYIFALAYHKYVRKARQLMCIIQGRKL